MLIERYNKSMVGSIGLNSIVLSNNLSVKNLACRHAVSFKSLPDTFQSVPTSLFGNIKPDEVKDLITATEKTSPIGQGFTSKIFKIGDKIVKSTVPPPSTADLTDHIRFQNVKEYVALKRIEAIAPDIATKAHDVIQHKGFFSLVEDFVEGVHPHKNNISNSHLSHLLSNFAKLDTNGIVNADLQSRNIFLKKDGTTRLIDFGSYLFLSSSGYSLASDFSPSTLFTADEAAKAWLDTSAKTKVAKSFLADKAGDVKNVISNPHLNLHSNVSNFEFRTLHSYLLSGVEKNPLQFFKNYLKTKGEVYHSQFADFLRTINLDSELAEVASPDKLNAAKDKLSSAIQFEDMAKQVFVNPSDDIVKAELAKIQLRTFLAPDTISSNVPNVFKLRAAYNQLDDLLTSGYNKSSGVSKNYFKECLDALHKQFADYQFDAMQVNIPASENLVDNLFSNSQQINNGIHNLKKTNKKVWAAAAIGFGLVSVVAGILVFKGRRKTSSAASNIQNSNAYKLDNVVKTDTKKINENNTTAQIVETKTVLNPFSQANTPSVFSQFL